MAESKLRGPYKKVETKDDQRLSLAGISFSVDELVSCDWATFDRRMKEHNTEQIRICKDVRKRCRNRRAAAECRSRCRDLGKHLREKTAATEKRLFELKKQQADIIIEKEIVGFNIDAIVNKVLKELDYDPEHFTLVWRQDGGEWKHAVEHLEENGGEPETSVKRFFPPN